MRVRVRVRAKVRVRVRGLSNEEEPTKKNPKELKRKNRYRSIFEELKRRIDIETDPFSKS